MQSEVTEVSERTKGSRRCHPKVCHLGLLIIFSCRHLENNKSRERLSLNSCYLTEDRSSKKNSVVIHPLLGSFINQGRLTLVTRSPQHTWRDCHKVSHFPSILLGAHSSFLMNLHSPKRPMPHSPSHPLLRWYVSLNSKLTTECYSPLPGYVPHIHV